ncbi:PD40 domain-containing protein [Agaribacterium haliotis]|uniref:HzsA-related protein n=1 Tax=Agaribacterium haliotis TaxID=2013869 RepID=UPI000BB5837C|nr:PD40 domain-containing protein [Agaribacterium haliotis]
MKIKLIFLLGLGGLSAALLSGCDASGGVNGSSRGSQAADPVVVDYPIAYVKRPIPIDEDGLVVAKSPLDPAAFKPGAQLIIKDRAQASAAEEIVTDKLFPADEESGLPALYDVKDLSVSYDGLKLLFALRAPEDPNLDDDEQPSWNIWQYNRESGELRRIISSDLQAELGDDIAPRYLPDDRIVFSSTRQPRSKAILLDENKPQFDPGTEDDRDMPTFVLHIMDEDGGNIEQLTYNQSHDLDPVVLDDGRIAFVRWDNFIGGEDRVSLYTTQADGSSTSHLFGYHSQNTGTDASEAIRIKPIQTQDGRLLVGLQAREVDSQGGDIAYIDYLNYVGVGLPFANGSDGGDAQLSASVGEVYTNDGVSPRGYFSSVFPLYDGTGRLLASWAGCVVEGIKIGVYLNHDGLLVNGYGDFVNKDGDKLASTEQPVAADASDVQAFPCGANVVALDELSIASPNYALWTVEPEEGTVRPVVLAESGSMFTDAVVMQEYQLPDFYVPEPLDDMQVELRDDNLGAVHIHSVYELHGSDNSGSSISAVADPLLTPAEQRPARFLRLLKAVSLPNEDVYDFDNSAFGLRARGQMKDIIGYVPIEPDGSVKFAVPADIAFSFQVVDENGRAIDGNIGSTHANWLSVRAGEVRECGGCHESGSTEPHGRLEAEADFSYVGALGAVPFNNTQLLDEFDTAEPAPEFGETMAEYYARLRGPRRPSVNLHYDDEWTDQSVTARSNSIDIAYADLNIGAAPASPACQLEWNALCRSVINYLENIAPLWQADRRVFDDMDPSLLLIDRTCTSCHSRTDINGATRVPVAQLELTNEQSQDNNDYVTSYVELLRGDVPQVLNEDGALVNQQQEVPAVDGNGNPVYVIATDPVTGERLTDPVTGEFILLTDASGNPIQDTMLVDVAAGPAPMPGPARDSERFFSRFESGAIHDGWLNQAELKLIAEWLDIGAQYYNNPFEAPE